MKSDDFPDDGDGHIFPGQVFGATVLREEWKLSVPLGFAFGDLMVGLVPELTLGATLLDRECSSICGGAEIVGFEQDFALYLTFGFEGGSLPPTPREPDPLDWEPPAQRATNLSRVDHRVARR